MCHEHVTWKELSEEHGVLYFQFLLRESLDLLYNSLE